MAADIPPNAPLPAWRTCLDIEELPAGHYLGYVNTQLLDAIEGAPRRVLDLGCAAGALGAALKQRHPGTHVVGVEASRNAAEAARQRLDEVVCARIESLDWDSLGRFDAVLAADVLEHIVNPWRALERVRGLLQPRGQLVASIPNVRNLQVVMPLLLDGRWPYVERGLLDVTHLRFFTLEEIRLMLEQTGFRMESCGSILMPALIDLHEKMRAGASGTLTIGRMTLTGITPREATELCASQFVVRARPA